MGEIELVKNLEGWAGPLIYDWDALFKDWEIDSSRDKELPYWCFTKGDPFKNDRCYVGLHLYDKIFSDDYEWSIHVDSTNPKCWAEFSWMKSLTQEEMLGLANYCHKRLKFIPRALAATNVLENLTKYGILGPRAMEGKKKFWKK